MTQLYLDNIEVQVDQTTVRQTLQANVLGEAKDRQLNFTNQFTLPLTANNEAFFGYLGTLSNVSDKPYQILDARLVENGIELVNDGTARVQTSNTGEVKVNIYSGINALFDIIGEASIRTLNFSDINHVATEQLIKDSWSNTTGYIYAISGTTGELPVSRNYTPDYMLPCVYEHYLFDKILTEAGFTYTGNIFSNVDYLSVLTGPASFDKASTNYLVKDFSKILPEMTRKDFIKEILWRYGLMPKKVRNRAEYEFKQMKDILTDSGTAVDYTRQFSDFSQVAYTWNSYGKDNYFRYAEHSDGSTDQDGKITLTDEKLTGTKTIATSKYRANVDITPFNYVVNEIFTFDDSGKITIKTTKPWIARAQVETISQFFYDATGAATNQYDGPAPFAQFIDLSWSRSIANYYSEFTQVINKSQVVEAFFYFSTLDIYNLDFTRLIHLQQTGQYYYLNKVLNYQPNTRTKVELVKIPASVFAPTPANQPPVVDLEVDNNSIRVGDVSTFTLTVTDPDGPTDLDTWNLDFGDTTSTGGTGVPTTPIVHSYPIGTYTATLTVTDFGGHTVQDSVIITISDNPQMTFDRDTGELTAPQGETITVSINITGVGDATAEVFVRDSLPSGPQLAFVRGCLNEPGCTPITSVTFTMPVDESVFAVGTYVLGGSGLTGNQADLTFQLGTESITIQFDETDPLP